jgi:hypothetical protein
MTRANIIDQVNNYIGTTLTSTWTDAKINQLIDNALSEISEAVPYVMMDIYQIESRRGTATSTSSDNLVDATNLQFLSTDVGRVIYNTTDKTWAQIQSYSSTSQVGLTRDIMASGESYEIYNQNCWNQRQINIEDSGDFLWVIGAVYPANPNLMAWGSSPNMRNVKLLSQNRIAEIDTAYVSNTKDSNADEDVYLFLARQHHLDVETDLVGETTATGAIGATSIAVDGLTTSGTYYKNSLFYFTTIDDVTMDSRLTYRLTADTTMSSGAGTIYFYPPLECAVADNDDIQFISSTLTPDLERILIDIVTGQILMGEAISKANAVPVGGGNVSAITFDMGRNILERARMQLKGLVDVDLRADKVLAR